MRNHIDVTFQKCKQKKKKALILYITAGYPQLSEQSDLVVDLEKSGADLLEIGVPFSDPIADGPTIQFSSHEALKKGTNLKEILSWARSLRLKVDLPFVMMTYLNPVLRYGVDRFAKDAKDAGFSGLIIPDLIPEEANELEESLGRRGLYLIFLLAPTTPPKRQKSISKQGGGFIYAVSVTGVTGARKKYSAETKKWLHKLKTSSGKPVCVGFGISKPGQIAELKKSVDGFIVGSALIDVIRRYKGQLRKKKVNQFVQQLSKECFYGH
ncbi:tryptophan synthase subunit alpha [bacterium F11]|nr:tryptophan synthase subunit alpha [bacterium F11]